ncbi:hypothetical protein ES703_22462 [subsurface metagenome]
MSLKCLLIILMSEYREDFMPKILPATGGPGAARVA